MRLAIVTTNRNYPWGGAEYLWHALALAARSKGWPVMAFAGPLTLDLQPINQLRAAGVEILCLPPSDYVAGGRLAGIRKLHRKLSGAFTGAGAALRAFAPDLLFVNQCGAFDGAHELWLQGSIARSGVPYITVTHNNDGMVLTPADHAASLSWVKGARSTAFVSSELLQMAGRQLRQAIHRSTIVQNPINASVTALPWPSCPPWKLAVVGRIEIHEKGLDVIIGAAADALGAESDWELDFFGRGPDESALLGLAESHGIRDKVRIRGYKSNPLEIWQDHHLCVLGSRWEGFSLVMAEAMSCGRPILRTRSGGAGWVVHGQTGWLCEPADPGSLSVTLRKAWSQRHDWPSMGLAARNLFSDIADPAPVASLLDYLVTSYSSTQ
jgi:glycosyltransferase involved in cell wall biosynthesis